MPEKTFGLSSHDGSFFKAGDTAGVYFERILEHPVDRVWAGLTENEHLAKWLAPAIIEGEKGGSISLQLTGRILGGTITEWKEEALLEYVWHNGSTVRWELLKEGRGRTRLVFTHRHVKDGQLVDAAKGWHYHLDLLALELDGQPMPRNPVALWDDITREATVRYNAAAMLLAQAPEPEPFVIERVFDAPVARVWQALTNKEELMQWSFNIPDFEPEEGYEFTFNGQSESGQKKIHHCRITEVVDQRKLAYSWRYQNMKGISHVTWELFPEGRKTRLRLTHAGLEKFAHAGADFRRQNFEMGWGGIFGMLATWLQRTPVAAAR
jgi:uncharacterized protein YndB with AHSA1/START domain